MFRIVGDSCCDAIQAVVYCPGEVESAGWGEGDGPF